jgi:polyisoprenoid-binding protein YceI
MSRTLAFTAAAALLFGAAPAFAKTTSWTIDPTHSSVVFKVRHMMVTDVFGEFGKISGTATIDFENPTADAVEATVDAGSVSTRDEKRDGHLKSPDFFDVAKFPSLTFKSKKSVKAGEGIKLTGDLTIHGVTKEVTFEVTGPAHPIKAPWGSVITAASGTVKINRGDYGLKWNKAVEAGGVLVGEEVTINITLELIAAAPPTAKK